MDATVSDSDVNQLIRLLEQKMQEQRNETMLKVSREIYEQTSFSFSVEVINTISKNTTAHFRTVFPSISATYIQLSVDADSYDDHQDEPGFYVGNSTVVSKENEIPFFTDMKTETDAYIAKRAGMQGSTILDLCAKHARPRVMNIAAQLFDNDRHEEEIVMQIEGDIVDKNGEVLPLILKENESIRVTVTGKRGTDRTDHVSEVLDGGQALKTIDEIMQRRASLLARIKHKLKFEPDFKLSKPPRRYGLCDGTNFNIDFAEYMVKFPDREKEEPLLFALKSNLARPEMIKEGTCVIQSLRLCRVQCGNKKGKGRGKVAILGIQAAFRFKLPSEKEEVECVICMETVSEAAAWSCAACESVMHVECAQQWRTQCSKAKVEEEEEEEGDEQGDEQDKSVGPFAFCPTCNESM